MMNNTMKLNRTALQQQFLTSAYQEVLPFYRRYISQKRTRKGQQKDIENLPTNRRNATSTRVQAKKQLLADIKTQVENDSKKEISDGLKMDIKQLITSKKNLFSMINRKIANFLKKEWELDARDIKIYVDLIKVELGEPTTIARNENKNTEISDELSEEDKALVAQLKSIKS